MKRYMTVRFALDGDLVSDNRGCRSVEEAWAATDDGSRWYFYPLPVVILDHGRGFVSGTQRIVDAPTEDCYIGPYSINIGAAKGRSIRGLSRWLKAQLDT